MNNEYNENYRFNDDSILIGKAESVDTKAPSTENQIEIVDSTTEDSIVSSDADSDFIDVPEVDSDIDNVFVSNSKNPLPSPFLMNEPPLVAVSKGTNENEKIEVLINPDALPDKSDDIFADIFETIDLEQRQQNDQIKETQFVAEEDPNKLDIQSSTNQIASGTEFKKTEKTKIKSILNDLDSEMSTVASLNLDNLLEQKSPKAKFEDGSNHNSFKNNVEDNILVEPSTPPKIPQPFFVKKTPPSSKKKSNASDEPTDSLTHTKASKSLISMFDSAFAVPSTSKTDIPDERETLQRAADVLREQKSKKELNDIANSLSEERRNITNEMNKKERLGVSITEQMSMECMELLRLFGIPYIIAPMEAEAQCAYLNENNLTDGTITDDSDIWLFGGKTVYKNFFDQNKLVMEFSADNIEKLFHLDRRKLIQLAFLVGSDYTPGINPEIDSD